MSTKLVIVESPAKAKTIGKYLGEDFKVEASMGHIRDLPSSRLGIEIEKDFEPEYEIIDSRRKTFTKLKKAVRESDEFYLAPDPDREGEAIAWHLAEALRLPADKTFRVTFNEITKRAVLAAFDNPSRLDHKKIDAQQARRILDRLVGYKISPLLWKKVAKGLSAGRVQSVAVRLIVEREREVEAFNAEEYWRIIAKLSAHDRKKPPQPFLAELRELDGKEVGLGKAVPIQSGDEAAQLKEELEKATYKIIDIRQKRQKNNPSPPFITSTLQQQASTRLGYTAQRTMRIAQDLYEGIDVGGGEGPVGLITYMRTDSVRVAAEALEGVRRLIAHDYGKEYLPEEPNFYKSKAGAQEAHEAVRPTDVDRTPESVKPHLETQQFKLYKLIWERFVASQMPPAEYDVTEADIEAGRALFIARGRVMIFDGHLKVLGRPADRKSAKAKKEEEEENGVQAADLSDQVLPPLETGQPLDLHELSPSQHFTKPPPRYTEASLVKTLEKEGIGRPSTYAPIISTIQDRGYVKRQSRQLHPTDLGVLVTDKLVKHFPDIMDIKFTSGMEENLDKVEEGTDWVKVTRDFYVLFKKDLDKAVTEMQRVSDDLAQEDVKIDCEKCGEKMVIRLSKRGKFLGCSAFPRCRNTKPMPGSEEEEQMARLAEPEETDAKCDECGKAMVVRLARRGRSRGSRFFACSGYPKCKSIKPYTTSVPCPKDGCEGLLVEKAGKGRVFYGCSKYPDCDQVANELPQSDSKPSTPESDTQPEAPPPPEG